MKESSKNHASVFAGIFSRLRGILAGYAPPLVVSADRDDYYCLTIPYSPKFKKSFPVAWVKSSKSYVSFHFMPIYISPVLQKELSKRLKRRMQGKSCFNFKEPDEVLFEDLEKITAKGFALSKKLGVM
ncbi:MAG TPA: hypothetical protein VMG34_04540 [Bacteroidota bacterium]|nr:hypothetical protein [Bacteroidota bacterium]